ncbi:uncharacterized protein [Palaemon carinicauda]|uniref:uncharacterized protein n=1 Tax=Palaemon carinicauda TaxID=392227 RepID=UPI0035B6A331
MATILFACFITENNLPFTTADNLVDLMKRMFPDSAIAQSLFMKRTKCTCTDVIKTMGRTVTNSQAKKLRSSKFSVIRDESTDVSTTKSCAVIVRFCDSSVQKITTAMLDLVNLYDSDNNAQGSTGQNLYSLLINTLTKYDIPLSNFIGFAADGASNIMGEHNSLCSRLKHLFFFSQGITVFKCICHSIHLCSSEAAKNLPRHCEDLLRSIYTFFAHSSKRQYDFKFCQEVFSQLEVIGALLDNQLLTEKKMSFESFVGYKNPTFQVSSANMKVVETSRKRKNRKKIHVVGTETYCLGEQQPGDEGLPDKHPIRDKTDYNLDTPRTRGISP